MNLLLHTIITASLTGPAPIASEPPRDEASTSTTDGDHYPAHITIDTTGLAHDDFGPDDVQKQQDVFERDLPPLFLDAGLADAESLNSAEVLVLFHWDDFAKFQYGVTFQVTPPDGEQREHSLVFQGDEYDLLKHLKGEVPSVIALLERPSGPQDVAPRPLPPTGPEAPSDTNPGAEPKHTLRWVGVGVGLAGLAAGVTGAVLMPRSRSQPQFEDQRFGSEMQRRHPLPITAALVGIGGAGVLAGVVLIVIDTRRAKNAKRASVAPTFGNQRVGLTLTGRF